MRSSNVILRSLVGTAFVAGLAAGCSPSGNGGGGDDDDGGGHGDGSVGPGVDACPCPNPDGGGPNPDGGSNGCTGPGAGVAQPFGNHARPYAMGTILPNHRTQAQLDSAVRGFYDEWKGNYLKAGCGTNRSYVATGMNNSLTVSEAHGYGMLILAYMAGHDPTAKARFDGMFAYYQDHPSAATPALMAWSQGTSCANNQGADSATDGDLDIAYALLLADKQWSSGGTINYAAEAERIIDGIRDGDVDATAGYVLLGDWATSGQLHDATRSSDFMPAHFASFAAATGDADWRNLRDRSYTIMDTLQTRSAPTTGLLPDFLTRPLTDPRPAPAGLLEGNNDGAYSYNACRDPWRIAIDALVNGDARAKTMTRRMNTWIKSSTGGNPAAIRPGYSLAGTGLGGDYLDLSFVAPFGVSAMVDASNQAWLNSVWDTTISNGDNGYYADTIAMLSLIAMSGNWWTPEAAPCP